MSDTEDTFNRAFARFEEIQAQYRADRERLIADDEARQQDFIEREKERQRLDEETLAEIAEATEENEQEPRLRNSWAETVKPPSEFAFGFEDEPATDSFEKVPESVRPVEPPDSRLTNQKVPATPDSDDDFFGTADWLQK